MNHTRHLLDNVRSQIKTAKSRSEQHWNYEVRHRMTGRLRALRWVERRLKQIVVLEGIEV